MPWNTKTALKLGRVSNLPTVWSNTLAGVVLAGASPLNWNILTLLLAMTLAYTGGMFLNDAYDRKVDAKERPERPIPSGEISAPEVFAAGFTLLFGAVFFTIVAVLGWHGNFAMAVGAAIALCAAIVLYNVWHKNNPLSPVIMGTCRMLVYLCAGFTASTQPFPQLYIGALVLLAYLIGLTYVAKQENLATPKNLWPVALIATPLLFGVIAALTDAQVWIPLTALAIWVGFCLYLVQRRNSGDIPRAVVSMIAGIALVDAVFIATTSSLLMSALAGAAFVLTLFLQRYISGT
jgi:4-hydroxybenzoate polyprenyltransferase